MVEVISLLSSPPKSPGLPTRRSSRKSSTRKDDLFTLYSDDFDSTGDISFALPSSTKRRKLNGPSVNRFSRSGRSSRATSLQPGYGNDGLPEASPAITNAFKITKSMDTELTDSITFSSSAPQPKTVKRGADTTIFDLSDDLPDDIFNELAASALQPMAATSRQQLAERTANFLASTETDTAKLKAPVKDRNRFRISGASKAEAAVVDDIFGSSPPKAQASKSRKSKLSEEEKAAQAARSAEARASSKAAKDAEKEAEKQRKRLEKEEKVREKQKADDIAEVNKEKTDKKVSAKEMILDMSRGFRGLSAGNQVEEHMKELEVELNYLEEEIDLSTADDGGFVYPGNFVKWRRKVEAQYNEDEGHWEPITRAKIEQEKHILIHLTAVEFATIAAQPPIPNASLPIDEAAMKANLDKHITYIYSLVKDSKPIYLIEGLESWLRKNATAKNRAYTAAVLAQNSASSQALPSSQPARPRKRNKATLPTLDLSHIDFDLAERLQLHLQLHSLRPLIHLTTSATSTATWIKTFTEHISTIPYRRLKLTSNLTSASFCMDSGQVKTGENPQDTYVKMLQEVQRVTPSMAYGIASQYGDVKALVRGFKREGPLMLEDVKKSANKDGAVSERRLGPQVSRRLCKVFMGKDEESMDGIA